MTQDGINAEQVRHLGKLARLELTSEEVEHYAAQLEQILSAITSISAVATQEIPPTSHPIPMENVYRDDLALPGLELADFVPGAPAFEDDRFRVPRILGEPS
ncbi:MAG: Asp-tRNA(Asn)/Glu-tRNA(Gln) amidotransferase subunit GatC [Candidatus Nanopelagicales bacterium]|jgi:aspartyl-tRNA(Asn)/glutamyl-tRNA(Gln) amidotransferase subunit C|nr:Asp-tRNA(Asn)/Glu-tRNA(Gln) amidotransferase subunit GatC [Actinomycetes bacterium]MCH9739011.1 Asp-tRNA(Asn)/Glu-tRNA(Gln) amidotransferase subunit GatC [Actinomycetes bacterium]MCH9839845.1 Asp-tRNA(Asn)/Glu-tRNA(Gln) amidotransferase subunit GatC [Actinomycetes bacterium]